MIETILAGIQAVASITHILRGMASNQTNDMMATVIGRVEARVKAIEAEIQQSSYQRDAQNLQRLYTALLETVNANEPYASRLDVIPSFDGSLRIVVRKQRRRKQVILRDPAGEYGGSQEQKFHEEPIEIDEQGNVHSSWIPEQPEACRCKDKLDMREVIAFNTLTTLLHPRKRIPNTVRWLDLCCGRGSLLAQWMSLGEEISKRVEYQGFDRESAHVKECCRIIKEKDLGTRVRADVHDVTHSLLGWKIGKFDFVTLLNVLHEIPPFEIYDVLSNAFRHCKSGGSLLLVDMCWLPHAEWRAIAWQREYLNQLLQPLLRNQELPNILPGNAEIAVYRRKVEVFSVLLARKRVHEALFADSDEILRRDFQKNVRRCLTKMKSDVSKRIVKTYERPDSSHGKDAKPDLSREEMLKQLLWTYWAISESLALRASR